MKKTIIYALTVVMAYFSLTACQNKEKKTEKDEDMEKIEKIENKKDEEKDKKEGDNKDEEEKDNKNDKKDVGTPDEPIFNIVTNMGTIKVKLYSKTPLHRDNFAKLSLAGEYDGILFHRVIKNFMIQTGDPLTRDPEKKGSWGTGSIGQEIPAEIIPEYTHKKGALAAARRGDKANPKKESSGSQFYIVHNANGCIHLNGEYTVFGETIEGLEVVDKIAGVETDYLKCPKKDVKIIKIVPEKENGTADKDETSER